MPDSGFRYAARRRGRAEESWSTMQLLFLRLLVERSAHNGVRGDGRIYVSNVEQAIRISKGERGKPAI